MKQTTLAIFLGANLLVPATGAAEEVQSEEVLPQEGLVLPADLSLDNDEDKGYKEFRVGGRLERVTVTRKYGWKEEYRNKRNDSLWTADEAELGEVQNMREWTIGSW